MEEPNNQINQTQSSQNPDVNKPVEIPLPVQSPPPPSSLIVQKKPRKFKTLLIALLLIVIGGLSGFVYSEIKNADKRPIIYKIGDIENQKEETFVENKEVIFAKQTSSVSTKDNKSIPIYSVYKMGIDGSGKELLFTAGDKEEYPLDFKLLPSKTGLIINYENRLVLYNFSKKSSKEIFKAEENGYILGYTLSKDESKIAVNVTYGLYIKGESKYKIYTNEIDADNQKVIIENKNDGASLVPNFWSPDGKKIFLKETFASEKMGNYWEVSSDGTGLNKLPIKIFGEFSPDGKTYAYFDYDGSAPKWLCFGFQPNVLKVYDLFNSFSSSRETVVETAANKRFALIRWADDGTKFMYVSQLYKSGEGCRSDFYPEETYVYNAKYNNLEKSLKSKTDLQKEWYPGEPDVQIKLGEQGKSGDSMVINGFLADQTDNYNLKIVYIGYLN